MHITTLKFIFRILGMLMMEVTTGFCNNEDVINNMPLLIQSIRKTALSQTIL